MKVLNKYKKTFHTKVFDNLELANVKTVQTALAKKEKIKEQSLIRAYESLNKLKKFGINI
ncbi:MAG TPA: hypothetical protein PKN22_09865 [Taishania sp.]|nr:hypothetical protein [Taishania sp.]HNS43052.1 hypothetical protein [Taishania sp.]